MNTLDRTKAPAVSSLSYMTVPQPRRYRLSNGITLVVLSGGDDEVWRITALLQGAGMAESPHPAVASLAATMLCEGTRDKSSEQVADMLDYTGSWYTPTVQSHHLIAQISGLDSGLESVAPLMAEMLSQPLMGESELAVQRQQLVSRLEVESEKVTYHADKAAERLAMGATHPLARVSTPDEAAAITAADIADFYYSRFAPERLTLFVAGRIDDAMERIIVKAMEAIPAKDTEDTPPDIVPYRPTVGVEVEIPRPGAMQSAVAMTLPAVGRHHPDYIPLRIAVMALGGYFGSRLMMNVREDKGYTYGISSHLMGLHEGGYIRIDSSTDPQYVRALIEQVRSEIEGMSTRPLAADELDRLRRHYTTALVAQLDSPFTMIDLYRDHLTLGTPDDYFHRQQQALARLTPEMIADVSARYLRPDLLSIAIAGPEA